MAHLSVIFVTDEYAESTLKDILALPENSGLKTDSHLSRAVILSGLMEKELHKIMKGYQSLELAPQFWAALTPTSENWTMKYLLEELAEENRAVHAQKNK